MKKRQEARDAEAKKESVEGNDGNIYPQTSRGTEQWVGGRRLGWDNKILVRKKRRESSGKKTVKSGVKTCRIWLPICRPPLNYIIEVINYLNDLITTLKKLLRYDL